MKRTVTVLLLLLVLGVAASRSDSFIFGNSRKYHAGGTSVSGGGSGLLGCKTIPGTAITIGAACLARSSYPTIGTSFDPVAYGADSTGVADSSVAVQTALSHGNVYFGTPGTYKLDPYVAGVGRYIPVTTAGTVIECAAGVTLKTTINFGNPFGSACTGSGTPYACCTGAGTGTCALTSIFLIQGNNVSIAGCTFLGPGPNSGNTNNGNLMIWTYAARGTLIEGNTFTNAIGDDAINIDDETNISTGPESYIQYNDFLNDHVYGPAVIFGHHITLQNNYALNSSIGVESDDLNAEQVPQPMGQITVTHNEVIGDASGTINGLGISPGATVDGWPHAVTYPYYGTNTVTANYCASPIVGPGIIYDAGEGFPTSYINPFATVTGNTKGTGCTCYSGAGSC